MIVYVVNEDGSYGGETEYVDQFGILPEGYTRISPPKEIDFESVEFDSELRVWVVKKQVEINSQE